MQTFYGYNDSGQLVSLRQTDGPRGRRETEIAPPPGPGPWYWADGGWRETPRPPKLGPIAFRLLWTSAERLRLKELRPNDAALDDFFEIIEDPRLEYVDLSLGSTAAGVDHCLSLLEGAGVIAAEDVATRREQILSGVMI